MRKQQRTRSPQTVKASVKKRAGNPVLPAYSRTQVVEAVTPNPAGTTSLAVFYAGRVFPSFLANA